VGKVYYFSLDQYVTMVPDRNTEIDETLVLIKITTPSEREKQQPFFGLVAHNASQVIVCRNGGEKGSYFV
jgi:hypothetical protein